MRSRISTRIAEARNSGVDRRLEETLAAVITCRVEAAPRDLHAEDGDDDFSQIPSAGAHYCEPGTAYRSSRRRQMVRRNVHALSREGDNAPMLSTPVQTGPSLMLSCDLGGI